MQKALERPDTWQSALDALPAPGALSSAEPVRVACYHYLAGAAAFFLSERAPEQAARAVEQLSAARLLQPDSMDHVQARSRLKMAWSRLGEVPGVTAKGALAEVAVVPGSQASAFTLRPAHSASPLFELPAPTAGAHLLVPPGDWRVTVNGRCGGSDMDFTVAGGTGRVTLPNPPPCHVQLDAVDAAGTPLTGLTFRRADGTPLEAAAVTESSGDVTLVAPSHLPATVSLAVGAGPRKIVLQRCPVDLKVQATPADAQIVGGGPAAWGPRQVTISRAGYRSLTQTVDVPAPERCEGAAQAHTVTLLRPVQIDAHYEDGMVATPSEIVVDGQSVPMMGFDRPVGRYAWSARAPEALPVQGVLDVLSCGAADCPPARLEIALRHPRSSLPPLFVTGAGATLVAGGLIAGASAWSTQKDIDGYTTKARENIGVDTLIDRRNQAATAANVLVGVGAATLAAGLVWYWLGSD